MPRKQKQILTLEDLSLAALEELAGKATIVIDDELRVVGATERAMALLGPVRAGARVSTLLCGNAPERPIAEALAVGKPVAALVPGVRGNVGQPLSVSTVPVRIRGKRVGWVLLIDELPVASLGPELFHGMWTADASMKQLFRLVEKVAKSAATVLVRGETGSGKELVANAIHALSSRSTGPMRAINCAAVPAALLESELFGHVRGAFTGAVRDTPGQFKLAHKGTLFLDEVAELPLEVQAKLLRVLETRTVMPVGAREPQEVDVRIVAATHRALRKDVENGRFRADLMYRLRVIPVFIPPLHARGDDVVLLAERFIQELNLRSPRQIQRISSGARDVLVRYDWPGNVRELRNAIEYAFAIGDGPVLVEGELPPGLVGPADYDNESLPKEPPPEAVPASPEAARILRAVERARGSRARAAQILGMSRVTLWRRMKELGLV